MNNTSHATAGSDRMQRLGPMENGPRNAFRSGVVPPGESERLRGSLGKLLADERRKAGYSARRLAQRAGLAVSTVTRLEYGAMRPRPGTLRMLAAALTTTDPGDLADRLIEAAGESLVPDNEQSRARAAGFRPQAEPVRWVGYCPLCGRR